MLNDLKKEIKIIQRQLVFCGVYAILLSIAFVFVAYLAIDMKRENDVLRSVNETLIELQKESVEVPTEGIELSNIPVEVAEYQEVYFTNYYPNDAEGSTHKTGSGLSTDSFQVNDAGFYTYDGKVVIATATYECLKSSYAGCSTVNSMDDVPSGYKVYNYYDELEIEINGVRYEGIVLDSCLASYWEREYQTYDIYITDKSKAFGKVRGRVYES